MRLMREYLDSLNVSKKTMESYKNNLANFKEYLNDIQKSTKTVSKGDLSDYGNYLIKNKGYKDTTANRYVQTARRMYKFLYNYEFLDKDYSVYLKPPKTRNKLPEYLTKNEVGKLLKTVQKNSDEILRYRDDFVIKLLVFHGLRIGEVARLTKLDIDDNIINIVGKGNKERKIYMANTVRSSLYQYLEQRQDNSEHLIVNRYGNPISVRGLQKMIKKHLENSGLGEYSAHTLRHTSATLMLSNGIGIREIQDILGHSNITTTQIYAHVDMENKKNVANKMDSLQFV